MWRRNCEKARTYYHYASDERGSITHVVDAKDCFAVEQSKYDAFDNVVVTSGCEQGKIHFGYTGERFDGITQQVYLRARFYSTAIGRFVSEDTYHGDGLNLYVYVANNPLKYVDPSGHKKCPGSSGKTAGKAGQVASKTSYGKSSGSSAYQGGKETELFLPDEYYKNLNKTIEEGYQSPNTREIYNRLGNTSHDVETSIVISDDYGRIQYRIDYSTHGNDLAHTNPHIHEFVSNTTKGKHHIQEFRYFVDDDTGKMRLGKANNDGTYRWLD